MNIFIAGAGEVGTHLARMLSKEDMDVTLMDPDVKLLKPFRQKGELLPIVGDPTNYEILQEKNAGEADLFVSVMPEEAANLIACIFAKRLGAKRTIARVNKADFLEGMSANIIANLGIGSIIYPEALASDEIISIIEHPWARQYVELFNGALVLVGVKVRNGAPIVGKQLYEFSSESRYFHIVAIRRDLNTVIPKGDTKIKHGDLLFFTTTPQKVEYIRKICNKKDPEIKKVIIMGASRIGCRVARKLNSRKIQVSIIDNNKEKIEALLDNETMPSPIRFFCGDGRSADILYDAGIKEAQVFIALTQNSETNVLACLAAKAHPNIFKTIAKEENIEYMNLAGRLNIGTLINKKLIAASFIYKNLLGADTGNVKCLTIVGSDVAELIAHRDSAIVGKKISELNLPSSITFGGMVRSGIPMIVSGDTIIEPYDAVVVFSSGQGLSYVSKLFD